MEYQAILRYCEHTIVIIDRDAESAEKLTRNFCFLNCKEKYCGAPDDSEF